MMSTPGTQQPFFSLLSTIFGSVGFACVRFSPLQRTVNVHHQGHYGLQFITLRGYI